MNQLLFASLLCFSSLVLSQDAQNSQYLPDDDPDEQNYREMLEQLFHDPLNINKASPADLEQFCFLPDTIIELLQQQRPFRNMNEIRKILGEDLYEMLEPYIQIEKDHPSRITIASQVLRKLDRYDKNFSGSMLSFTNTLQIQYALGLSVGLLIQKDAGEISFTDHFSGYVQWKFPGYDWYVIAGDFRLPSGQGLLSSSSFPAQKSADTGTTFRLPSSAGRGLSTSNENIFHRGIYLRFKSASWLVQDVFYTHSFHDANDIPVTAIASSGYHRSSREIKLMDLIQINGHGFRTEFLISKLLSLGYLIIQARFRPAITERKPDEKRKYFFDFSGSQVLNQSIYFTWNYGAVFCSGELALRDFSVPAGQITFLFKNLHTKTGIRIWYVPENYFAPYSVYSQNILNSAGFLMSASQKITRRLQCDGFISSQRSLWRSYFEPLPVLNKEYLIRILFSAQNHLNYSLHYLCKKKQIYHSNTPHLLKIQHQKVRLQTDKSFLKKLRVSLRVEYHQVRGNHQNETGMYFYQDLRWKITENIRLYFRYGSFDTPGYDTRIYQYENDLPFVFASRAVYGRGINWYIFTKCKLTSEFEMQLKFQMLQKYTQFFKEYILITDREFGFFLKYSWR